MLKLQYKVTLDEYLMGRDGEYPLDKSQWNNLVNLMMRINVLRSQYDKPMIVSSGYRPGKYNKGIGAPRSTHLTCEGIDIADESRELTNWLNRNAMMLEKLDLYWEDPDHTPRHVHLQTRKTQSGARIFKP